MAGKLELGPPKNVSPNLKEQSARIILRTVRSGGHPYVELRENGKKFIYFCVLCLAPCYSDNVLFDHLKGNLHKQRLASARKTLLRPNPWPFNDGLIFFDTSTENDKDLETTNGNQGRLLKLSDNDHNLAVVRYDAAVQSDVPPSSTDDMLNDDSTLTIPHLLIGDETVDVKIREVGLGKISARFVEKYNNNTSDQNGIKRMWCEWLGKENVRQQDGVEVPEHDYAVLIFSYNHDLGRSGWLDEVKSLLSSASMTDSENQRECSQERKPPPLSDSEDVASMTELENERGRGRKRKKPPLSDPEDIYDALSKQHDSAAQESSASDNSSSSLTLDQCDNQLLRTKFISSKAVRKELRRHQRIAAEKACNICQQKMLPGKDVAAILNLKTKRLACNSRNESGAFHVFHTSCVIHWILMCEYELITKRLVHLNVRQGDDLDVVSNSDKIGKEKSRGTARKHMIETVLCPECQGAGLDHLEHPSHSLSQMFKLKIKVCNGRIEWIKSPEDLQNCSVGFQFPLQIEETTEEKVEPLKLLRFYRADVSAADVRGA